MGKKTIQSISKKSEFSQGQNCIFKAPTYQWRLTDSLSNTAEWIGVMTGQAQGIWELKERVSSSPWETSQWRHRSGDSWTKSYNSALFGFPPQFHHHTGVLFLNPTSLIDALDLASLLVVGVLVLCDSKKIHTSP